MLPLYLHLQMVRLSSQRPRLATLPLITVLRDVKEPTHCSKRVGQGVPGVVVRPCCGRIPSIGITSRILGLVDMNMHISTTRNVNFYVSGDWDKIISKNLVN